jgi:DNA adenine methylase
MKLQAKPFVKWAGGKSQILNDIRAKYPSGLGNTITKYAEPFVGGGAVLFDILNKYDLSSVYISDINCELITTYKTIRDNVDKLINILYEMQTHYQSIDKNDRKAYYYNKRDRFNTIKADDVSGVELAAIFIFLNHTCFNGLYRVNSNGSFNTPMGDYKNPIIYSSDNLKAVSSHLKRTEIICGDYRQCLDFIDENTFAYFDPPYRPLSDTAKFVQYSKAAFKDREQAELAMFIDELVDKNAKVLVSNSDPKNIDENDRFFDILYEKYTISRICANRMINSSGNGRGKINELLISTY